MKKKILSIAILSIILISGMFSAQYMVNIESPDEIAYVDIGAEEATQLLIRSQDVTILDVRTRIEYESGHIAGAISIPLSELEGRIDELDRDGAIIVYCKSGVRSEKASNIFVNHGFKNAYNMLGGINAWTDAEFPVVSDSTNRKTWHEYGGKVPIRQVSAELGCCITTKGCKDNMTEDECKNDPNYFDFMEGDMCSEWTHCDKGCCEYTDSRCADGVEAIVCVFDEHFQGWWSEYKCCPDTGKCIKPEECCKDTDCDDHDCCTDDKCEDGVCQNIHVCKGVTCPEGEHCECQDCSPVCVSDVPEFPLGWAMEIMLIPLIIYMVWRTRKTSKLTGTLRRS